MELQTIADSLVSTGPFDSLNELDLNNYQLESLVLYLSQLVRDRDQGEYFKLFLV